MSDNVKCTLFEFLSSIDKEDMPLEEAGKIGGFAFDYCSVHGISKDMIYNYGIGDLFIYPMYVWEEAYEMYLDN